MKLLVRHLVCALLLMMHVGCMSFTRHAIPAARLPQQFQAPSKDSLEPINFKALSQSPVSQYVLDAGDIVAIVIEGIIPPDPKTLPPIIQGRMTLQNQYYPPTGEISGPTIGLPLTVDADGEIEIPLVRPVRVAGKTLQQAADAIRDAYVKEELLKEGRDRVNVTLIRGRVNRVLVLREDASLENANVMGRSSSIVNKRGSGMVLDLPFYECDVLHALIASGGLPGVDAHNEIWVLRNVDMIPQAGEAASLMAERGHTPEEIVAHVAPEQRALRIPLKLCVGEPFPFTREDMKLGDGDLIYIKPRENEYFYTGGLLPGAQIPLPRDEDLDVVEAIALANGSVGGFGGASSAVFRAGAGPGNIIPPRRVLILRKLPNGDQVPIRVDLNRAMKNPSERIRIMSGDFIMLYYTPSESAGNVALNMINFSYILSNN